MMNRSLPQFRSFVMGGFEACYALKDNDIRFDLIADTKHDECVKEDYRMLKMVGIQTVRESMSWEKVDKGDGVYDFERYEQMMAAGRSESLQQIWSLNHYDYPERLDPFTDAFIDAFATYAQAAVKKIREYVSGTIYINPINEINFWCWIGAYTGGWAPFAKGRKNADTFKRQLIRTTLAAMDAIWAVDKNVRFIQIEPLMRRVPTQPVTEGKKMILDDFVKVRFEVFDILAGKQEPELGGHPKYLDIIGLNYYIHGQEWIEGESFEEDDKNRDKFLPLDHPNRVSLSVLLKEVYDRFRRPMIITETGSYGPLRDSWWRKTLSEVDEALAMGLPLFGVCAYPVVDRPDWFKGHLTNSGLWDFAEGDEACQRIPHQETISLISSYAWKKHRDGVMEKIRLEQPESSSEWELGLTST